MLIRHCEDLFGANVTQLLGEDTRSDSGAEESTDSLHCEYSLTHSSDCIRVRA